MASRNYKYYQPNDKDLKDQYGDCVVRALTKVMSKTWMQVFDDLISYAKNFNAWSIVEEYGSERTIQESERILRYCNERERRNRKIEAKRKEEIESNITAALLGAISVGVPGIMFILWLLEII
jgi:hypothetical protein